MNEAQNQAALVISLMRQLEEVMQAENALLREMRLDRLQALQQEKVELAESYELAWRRLRQEPEILARLDEPTRSLLETTLRDFQQAVRRNAERLARARTVVEGVVRAITESVGGPQGARSYGASPKVSGDAGRVIAVAFDRRC
jgi:hypothetical protein